MRDTPVPIPNTTVKTHTADGTALETARESRRPPELKERPKAFTKRDAWRWPWTHLENRIYEKILQKCASGTTAWCMRKTQIGKTIEVVIGR